MVQHGDAYAEEGDDHDVPDVAVHGDDEDHTAKTPGIHTVMSPCETNTDRDNAHRDVGTVVHPGEHGGYGHDRDDTPDGREDRNREEGDTFHDSHWH